MYLVRTTSGDKILETANEVKNLDKKDVLEVYLLTKVGYDNLVSTSDIRDCIYKYLKDNQDTKDAVVDFVSEVLDIKRVKYQKLLQK